MGFLKFIIGIVSFVIAIKIAALVLGIIFTLLHLLWIAIVVGFLALVAYLIYKIVSPRRTEAV
jgi:phage shock protein PspC (stress-responsive transcriptional regulator)